MSTLVLVRHGQSTWNLENRFTGWVDVDLSEKGYAEAQEAGTELHEAGLRFDLAYTSRLRRAVRTLWLIQEQLDQMWLPVHTDWRLNERHYGALQGLNKKETVDRHGPEQVLRWRRGYAVRPPELPEDDAMHPKNDPVYADLTHPPAAESLADTLERVLAFWRDSLAPCLEAGQTPLVVAHGNSLRALVKYLDDISDDDIVELNIPTGMPLVYELDGDLKPLRHYYLASEERVAAAADAVKQQTGR